MSEVKKKTKKKRSPLSTIIFVLALAVFVVSAVYLVQYFAEGHKAQSDFDSLTTEDGYDLAELYAQNGDTVGWIKIEGTEVNYPVVQTPSDPEFYLRRNFQKEDSTAGTPFVDGASDMQTSANWIIYGHNMKNGSMFHDIIQYEDEDFYKEHKYITFDTIDELGGPGTYEVVAAYYTQVYTDQDDVFKYYQYPFIGDEGTYNAFIQGSKALCTYDTGLTPSYGQQLITLSTCAYHVEDGRFVVVAVKVDE